MGLAASTLGRAVGLSRLSFSSPCSSLAPSTCGRSRRLSAAAGCAERWSPLITAVGVSFILENLALVWRGASTVGVSDVLHEIAPSSRCGGRDPSHGRSLIGVTIPLVIVGVVRHPYAYGRAMHATAQDRETARRWGSTSTDDHAHVPHRRGPRRRRRTGVRALRVDDWYLQGWRAGLIARHGRGHGRNREPSRSVLGRLIIGCIQPDDRRPRRAPVDTVLRLVS